MKKLILLTVISGLSTYTLAETTPFSEADRNDDGALSTTEAKMALPDVLIVDNNNDGMLNPSEAEVAVPGLMLSTDEAEKSTALIGEEEYEHIVNAIANLEAGTSERSKS